MLSQVSVTETLALCSINCSILANNVFSINGITWYRQVTNSEIEQM